MKLLKLTAIAMIGALALSACQQGAPLSQPGMISFKQYPAYNLRVARVEVVDDYKSPMRAPNIEHTLPYSPAKAMHIWANDRLRATGQDKNLQVIIKDAGVVATDLPKTEGIKGLFTNDQDKRYDAKLDVELRIYGDEALSEANVAVNARRSVTVAEKATVAERNAILKKLVDDLMSDINSELDTNIPQYFSRYRN